jgi:pyroglutamyl-peptidase
MRRHDAAGHQVQQAPRSDAMPTPSRRPTTILVTGFGPFPGAHSNPTGELVRALARLRSPGLAAVRVIAHVFPTSYAAVDAELPALLEQHRPDALVMFGLAARTAHLRIETCARNARSGLLADASGRLPVTRHIRAGAPSRIVGRAPFERLAIALRAAGLPAGLSHNAGRYLCNYAYWRAIERTDAPTPRIVVFVHVPKLGTLSRPLARVRRRAVTAPDLLRAGEILLRLLAAAVRQR